MSGCFDAGSVIAYTGAVHATTRQEPAASEMSLGRRFRRALPTSVPSPRPWRRRAGRPTRRSSLGSARRARRWCSAWESPMRSGPTTIRHAVSPGASSLTGRSFSLAVHRRRRLALGRPGSKTPPIHRRCDPRFNGRRPLPLALHFSGLLPAFFVLGVGGLLFRPRISGIGGGTAERGVVDSSIAAGRFGSRVIRGRKWRVLGHSAVPGRLR